MRFGLDTFIFTNPIDRDFSWLRTDGIASLPIADGPSSFIASRPASGMIAAVPQASAQSSVTSVLDEGFETDGNGVRYVTSAPEYTDGSADYFTRTDGSTIGSFVNVTGFGGSFFFAAQDLDGDGEAAVQTLSFNGLNIAGLTNLMFAIDVAEDDASDGNEDWDASDFVRIEFQIDGGGFQNLLAFENDGTTFNTVPQLDTDFDGNGDGTALTSMFQTFSAAIAGAGSLLDIRITFALDSGDEDIAIDNVRVTGEAAFIPTTIFSANFDDFRGAGFAPEPGAGQLDSDIYRVTGLSDGDGAFGGTFTSGDFARGVDVNGGVTTGGVYAFEVGAGSGDYNFGLQPGGSDVTPGALDIVITNSGTDTDTFDIAYNIEFNNDQARANSLNLLVSTDGGATFVPVPAFDFTTPEAGDGNGFTTTARSGTVTLDSTIANGGSFILRFATDDVSGGGSRDEIAIDDIVVTTAPPSGGGGTPDPQPGELAIADASAAEDDGQITFTVTRTGGSDGAVSVAFAITADGTADAADFDSAAAGIVEFADGQTQATLTVTINPDSDIEPDENFTITLSNPTGGATISPAGTSATGTIINDDFPPSPETVIINEVLFDPATSLAGDANRDGTRDAAADEFIEIVNTGSQAVNLSGWTLSDDDGGDFTFPAGTILAPGQALVLFGGGTPPGNVNNGLANADFGGALVFTDDGSIGSGLANGGDLVELRNASGDLIDSFGYGSAGDFSGGNDTSATRSPDLQGGFADHDTVGDAGGALFSPGTRTDGSAFGDPALLTRINELRISEPGPDDGDYIELFGLAGLNLAGKTLVVISGEFEPGLVNFAFDLSNLTLDENGIGLIANQDIALSFPDIQLGSGDILADFDLFGSPSTFLIVDGFTGSQGADLDADNDGVFDVSIGTIIDSVSLVDGDENTDVNYSATVIGPDGSFTPAHSFREDDFGDFQIGVFGDLSFDTPGELNASLVLPPQEAAIFTIQGAGHISDFDGDRVTTTGIVTAIASNGFFMQDATGDGDAATSDAIFVSTGSAPSVAVGDELSVSGTVAELRPGGALTNLTTTQIVSVTDISVISTGNALPVAVLIGPDGISPPTEVIEDDNFTSFDPLTDGIDFWESLEGMLVEIQNPVAVDQTNGFGELWTAASDGAGNLTATNASSLSLLAIDGGEGALGVFNAGAGSDFNPERIQIDQSGSLTNPSLLNGTNFEIPDVTPGTVLNNVIGIVDYEFANFNVRPVQAVTVAEASSNIAEMTTLVTGAVNQLSVATYNILNFDINPDDGDDDVGSGRLDQIAFDIGVALNNPDIVVLQEVQDDSGAANDGTVSARLTLEALADAIFAETGVQYSVLDNPFVLDGQTGGQPGGNIRVAFLYREDRVDLDEASVFTVIDESTGQLDAAFANTRAPLGANFTFNGETVTVIGNHFTSKIGSDRTFSANQLPGNAGAFARAAQAAAVNGLVDTLLAANANANIVVAGDFNEFQFEEPMKVLTGQLDFDGSAVSEGSAVVLENLTFQLAPEDRFSVLFEGNAQALDHILATSNIAATAQIDAVHINTPLGNPGADHDPVLALFTIGAIPGLVINGGSGSDDIVGTDGGDTINAGSGNDSVDGGAGDDIIEGGSGNDTLFGNAGDDTISGGSGNDIIGGGDGADILTGGSGIDTFVIEAGKSAADADIITDFSRVERIALADADGRDIVIRQAGQDTEILADGVLVATVLNIRAGFVVNQVQYEGTPALIDAPPAIGRPIDLFRGSFDFDAFGQSACAAPLSAPFSGRSIAEIAGERMPFDSVFGTIEARPFIEPISLDPMDRKANPWMMIDTMGFEVF